MPEPSATTPRQTTYLPTSLSGRSGRSISSRADPEDAAGGIDTLLASLIRVSGSTRSVRLPEGLPNSKANLLVVGEVVFRRTVGGEMEGVQNTGGVSSRATSGIALFHVWRVAVLSNSKSAL